MYNKKIRVNLPLYFKYNIYASEVKTILVISEILVLSLIIIEMVVVFDH